jgi:RNA polymerase sigma-70 factor (ECF subfamily)
MPGREQQPGHLWSVLPDRYIIGMSPPARFATTRWSLVNAARDPAAPAARQALADLCKLYWFPIYSFVRRRGHTDDKAQDLTQEFFTRLLERDGLATADPQRGRFRSYLVAAFQHFLANQHDFETAQKRGGARAPLPLEFGDADSRYGLEAPGGRTPEQEFERRWALTMLDQALAALRAEYATGGKEALFERLKASLTGESEPYAVIAVDLGLSEGAVKVAAHRLRQRYRDCLRAAIAETVDSQEQIEDEIRALFAALSI